MILGSSPIPNQTMNTGIRPNSGSIRSDLQQRVDPVLAEPAQPGDQGEQHGYGAADREADRHPLQETSMAPCSVP